MKTIYISIILIIVSAGLALGQKSKKKVTTSFQVSGNCEMCKNRIEKAALIKGVVWAKWDKTSQTLKVTYKTKKTSEALIHKSISKAGHDTNKENALSDVYKNLPNCCLYRDNFNIH